VRVNVTLKPWSFAPLIPHLSPPLPPRPGRKGKDVGRPDGPRADASCEKQATSAKVADSANLRSLQHQLVSINHPCARTHRLGGYARLGRPRPKASASSFSRPALAIETDGFFRLASTEVRRGLRPEANDVPGRLFALHPPSVFPLSPRPGRRGKDVYGTLGLRPDASCQKQAKTKKVARWADLRLLKHHSDYQFATQTLVPTVSVGMHNWAVLGPRCR
jgi:hypothetical protein